MVPESFPACVSVVGWFLKPQEDAKGVKEDAKGVKDGAVLNH